MSDRHDVPGQDPNQGQRRGQRLKCRTVNSRTLMSPVEFDRGPGVRLTGFVVMGEVKVRTR